VAQSLKYIERCTGGNHNGGAWVGYVQTSKTGRTIYFNGRGFCRSSGGGVSGNHYDVETGEEFWISGVKKRSTNRHWAGSGRISIEANAVAEFLELTGQTTLDRTVFDVVDAFAETDREPIRELLNEPLDAPETAV
jgi:hypothetical protein